MPESSVIGMTTCASADAPCRFAEEDGEGGSEPTRALGVAPPRREMPNVHYRDFPDRGERHLLYTSFIMISSRVK